jgi:UDP-3-O-[3-hydroxymyristoyl] glucosamine N-acyltransferase
MEFSLAQIAAILNGTVEGDENKTVNRLDKIQEGKSGGISFLANEKYTLHIYETEATAVIVSEDFEASKPLKTNLIRVKDAYTGFTLLLEAYSTMLKSSFVGIEEPSYMDDSSRMGEHVYRGAFSYIGKNCQIGNHVIRLFIPVLEFAQIL